MDENNTKHNMIREYLLREMREGAFPPGSLLPSENALSERFGVSRQTVRQALSALSAEGRVLKKQGKGTYAAVHGSRFIGIMTTYVDEYIFPEIISGIDSVLESRGYSGIICYTNNTYEKERQCLEYLLGLDICGLIAEPSRSALESPNAYLYDLAEEKRIPLLFMHACPGSREGSLVGENDMEAGRIAALHLIENGHREIGGIFKTDDKQGAARLAGFMKAMEEKGLHLRNDQIIRYSTEDRESLFERQNLFDGCTAVIVYNDQIAAKLKSAAGFRVPEDISMVSFDDSRIAQDSGNSFTSVAHPKKMLGIKAAEALLGIIGKNDGPVRIIMEPELVIRGSVKKISKQEE